VRDVVERRLLDYWTREGYRVLKELDVDAVREFRNELVEHYSANSARKRLEYVRAFFRFCQQSGWSSSDPSGLVKSPRGQASLTLPFEAAEIEALLTAPATFNAKGRFKDGNRLRIRAMVLLLRYSGLRISDAAVLERARLSDDKLFLYTPKTGTPVWVPLPPSVVKALAESPSDDARYSLWNGRCLPMSAVKIGERTFPRLFEIAKVKNGTVHRFRDSFAVELLLKGVRLSRCRCCSGIRR
jgi:integrase/recombinase XerD